MTFVKTILKYLVFGLHSVMNRPLRTSHVSPSRAVIAKCTYSVVLVMVRSGGRGGRRRGLRPPRHYVHVLVTADLRNIILRLNIRQPVEFRKLIVCIVLESTIRMILVGSGFSAND